MKTLVVSLLALNLALIGCSKGYESSQNAFSEDMNGIIGGTPVQSTDTEARSTVLLYDLGAQGICTASILSNTLLVTAAHCVEGLTSDLRIVFNVSLDDPKLMMAKVVKTVQHPRWSLHQNDSLDNGDVALVIFNPNNAPLPPGFAPAKLLQDANLLVKGAVVTLAGYGISNGVSGDGSGVLRKVQTTIALPNLSGTEVLIEQRLGKGACHGDSGGPAYISVNGELHLFGVTSRGVADQFDDCSAFSAYTNLMPYKNWIALALAQP